jgi:8-oxo-dGTP pyrophosphatase MutT (NUDIX family)
MNNARRAARTIILDEEKGETAILEVRGGDYHKIPGGGVEAGESVKETAIREALEEGGCEVELIRKIGELEFVDPSDKNLVHHSVCFLAKKIKCHENQYFTKKELKNKFRLLWVSFDDAIKLFESVKSKIPFDLAMNNRDLKFIKMAKEFLENKK